jgi:flagellar motor switch protein FliN/FliY
MSGEPEHIAQTDERAAEVLDQDEIAALLQQAEEALGPANEPRDSAPRIIPFRLEELTSAPDAAQTAAREASRDVELDVRIELGRTQMVLEEALKLRRGSVVLLDELAGDPVNVYVNGRLVARGEVVVLNENFCVRVNELVAPLAARAG